MTILKSFRVDYQQRNRFIFFFKKKKTFKLQFKWFGIHWVPEFGETIKINHVQMTNRTELMIDLRIIYFMSWFQCAWAWSLSIIFSCMQIGLMRLPPHTFFCFISAGKVWLARATLSSLHIQFNEWKLKKKKW